jgi:hypothetical protein
LHTYLKTGTSSNFHWGIGIQQKAITTNGGGIMQQTRYINAHQTRRQSPPTSSTHPYDGTFEFSTEGAEVTSVPAESFPVNVKISQRNICVRFSQIFLFQKVKLTSYPKTINHRRQQLNKSLQQLVDKVLEILIPEEELAHASNCNNQY